MILVNSLALSHAYAEKAVKKGDTVIDATCGRGRDTLFLSGLAGANGQVHSFDIQEEAIAATTAMIEEKGLSNVNVIRASHADMLEYVKAGVSCVMFNLGYLPGTDHGVQTKGESTVRAIRAALQLLDRGGIISIVIYQGGDTGFRERDEVLAFCGDIDQKSFTVMKNEFPNQKNNPPIFICIERIS